MDVNVKLGSLTKPLVLPMHCSLFKVTMAVNMQLGSLTYHLVLRMQCSLFGVTKAVKVFSMCVLSERK